jgi:hypothetical protein
MSRLHFFSYYGWSKFFINSYIFVYFFYETFVIFFEVLKEEQFYVFFSKLFSHFDIW